MEPEIEIKMETRLQVNSYMLNNFSNKGTVGYHYIKRFLEYLLEEYKNNDFIDTINLRKMIKQLRIEAPYITVQRATNYFLKLEGIDDSFSNFMVSTIEQIIDINKPKFNTPKIDYEEEF